MSERLQEFYKEVFDVYPHSYRSNKWMTERLVKELYVRTHARPNAMAGLSPELQIWWRDLHKDQL